MLKELSIFFMKYTDLLQFYTKLHYVLKTFRRKENVLPLT